MGESGSDGPGAIRRGNVHAALLDERHGAGNYATVGASGKNINFVFGKAAALNVSYTVKNLFTTADPVLTFEAVLHVTVTAPEIELLRGSSLSDDDRAQAWSSMKEPQKGSRQ